MTISQSLEKAIKGLNLGDIVLRSITAELSEDIYPGLNLSLNENVSVQLRGPTCADISRFNEEGGERARVCFTLESAARILRGTADDLAKFSKDEVEAYVIATVSTSFLAYYELADKELDGDCLAEFGKHNAPFNLWPYWREVVQSACSRMGLPRIVLPTHRLKKSVESAPRQNVIGETQSEQD